MFKYRRDLKAKARALRARMTDAEQLLWSKLRRKQVLGVQFYRQRPVGDYIVDFYAPAAKLVIEVDGSQHLYDRHAQSDRTRDASLNGHCLQVLRFDNLQVLKETEAGMQIVHESVQAALHSNKSPLAPPFFKGGMASSGRSRNPDDSVSPFEKGGMASSGRSRNPDDSVPPFEKGGAGGI